MRSKWWATLLLLSLPLYAQVNQPGDFQIWNLYEADGRVSSRWGLHLETEFRYGDDASQLYLQFYQFNIHYWPVPWLIIGPGYRLQRIQVPANVMEYSPLLDLIAHTCCRDWKVTLRSRTQYRIFRPAIVSPFWRQRLRAKLTAPWKIPPLDLTPHISEEVFWEQGRGIDQNRVQAGVDYEVREGLKLEVVYLLRSLRDPPPWINHHALGLYLVAEL